MSERQLGVVGPIHKFEQPAREPFLRPVRSEACRGLQQLRDECIVIGADQRPETRTGFLGFQERLAPHGMSSSGDLDPLQRERKLTGKHAAHACNTFVADGSAFYAPAVRQFDNESDDARGRKIDAVHLGASGKRHVVAPQLDCLQGGRDQRPLTGRQPRDDEIARG